jgi:peptidoglycan hydrolase-like protein with peptidoglycan-binding domain
MAPNEIPTAEVTEGGMAGDLPGASHVFHIAPATKDEFNSLRPTLTPVSCWRIDQNRFAFDSSFVGEGGKNEFCLLARKRPPESKDAGLLAVFGHADATGNDDYNKTLSGRRAMAVYAVLVREVPLWEQIYSQPLGGDRWGILVIQTMLAAIGHPPGKIDGADGPRTRSAIKYFQQSAGLPATSENDPLTRAELMKRYMDHLCTDDSGAPFQYKPQDFLGKGEDLQGKAAYQGCSEFNPVRVFSKRRIEAWKPPEKHAERDAAQRVNRRVLVYVFPSNVRFAVDKWPCPRAAEGAGGCRKSFWSNGDERRKSTDRNRDFSGGADTFGCRFYDSFARFSPCEGARRTMAVWLLDAHHKRIPGAPYRIAGSSVSAAGIADTSGRAHLDNVFLGKECLLEWGEPGPAGSEPVLRYKMQLRLDFDEEASEKDDDREAALRLRNLGYGSPATLADNIEEFQADYGIDKKAWPDPATKQALWQAHAMGTEGTHKEETPAASEASQPKMRTLPWVESGAELTDDEDAEARMERLTEWHQRTQGSG